jgi:formyltetrahydrofolate hydrolase
MDPMATTCPSTMPILDNVVNFLCRRKHLVKKHDIYENRRRKKFKMQFFFAINAIEFKKLKKIEKTLFSREKKKKENEREKKLRNEKIRFSQMKCSNFFL